MYTAEGEIAKQLSDLSGLSGSTILPGLVLVLGKKQKTINDLLFVFLAVCFKMKIWNQRMMEKTGYSVIVCCHNFFCWRHVKIVPITTCHPISSFFNNKIRSLARALFSRFYTHV